MLMVINKHTQFAGPGRTNSNVVGYPMMPVYMSKMGGFLFITFGVIVLIASLFTINPIWNYGPYDPSPVSAGTQPDWYIGFADGALRLVPPGWEFVFLDRTWSFNILVPLVGLGLFIVARRDLPVHRGVGHRRQARAPHRPASPQRGHAHGDRRGGRHVLRGAVGGGVLRHHRDALLAHDGRRHPHAAGPAGRRPDHRLLRHEAHLHRAPEEGPRDRAARLRVRPHRPPPRRRVHRGAPAGRRVRALEARRQRHYEPLIVRPNAKGRIPWYENIRAACRAGSSRTASRRSRSPSSTLRSPTSTTSWSTSRPKRTSRSRAPTSAPAFRTPRTSRSTTVTTPRPRSPVERDHRRDGREEATNREKERGVVATRGLPSGCPGHEHRSRCSSPGHSCSSPVADDNGRNPAPP